MIYFGYPLDIHGWKPKPKPNPKPNPNPNLKTVGEKPTPNPKLEKPKPADTRTEPDPLPSLIQRTMRVGARQQSQWGQEARPASRATGYRASGGAKAVFSSKISLSKLHYLSITSNFLPHA